MAAGEEKTTELEVDSLDSILAKLDKDPQPLLAVPQYDPDAFDSMMTMSSEMWNEGEADEKGLTKSDLLPYGPAGLSKADLEQTFLTAAQKGVLEVVKDLHKFCGPEIVDTRDEDEYTALHRASYNGHTEVVEFLLSAGAKIDARTIDGWQPLHCACRWNKAEVASLLLQNGAQINAQSNGRQTPLHLAACNDHSKNTLELLLRHRDLDTTLRNGQDETAFEVAQRSGRYAFLFEIAAEEVDYWKFLP